MSKHTMIILSRILITAGVIVLVAALFYLSYKGWIKNGWKSRTAIIAGWGLICAFIGAALREGTL